MWTSHIGSFPLSYSINNIKRVLLDMIDIGLDVPPYPQLRSFIDIYLKPLEIFGLAVNKKGIYFSSQEKLLYSEIQAIDIPDAKTAMEIVRENNLKFKGFRAPITGVFTLSSRVYLADDISKGLQSTAIANIEIVDGFFKKYIYRVIDFVKDIGYNIIFFDEPSLTLIVGRKILFGWSEEKIIDILSSLAKRAYNSEVGIHICGSLNKKLFEIVIQVDGIKYYSFEFYSNPRNINVIDKSLLEKYDKIISPGIVSASKPIVESSNEASNILRKVYEAVNGRIDLVSGDCGFGGLKGVLGNEEDEYRIALGKLKVVVEATKSLAK
uniref:Methionine synthase n=1 Tax=Ignisphaera aggregans TaxID=334771 RepID=A0A7J3QDR1_9CREN